jgi:HNH endonuclease
MPRDKIPPEQYEKAYELARRVYEGALRHTDVVNELAELGLKRSSAGDFVAIYRHMRNGVIYKRAMSRDATEFFLVGIRRDDGEQAFRNGLTALSLHIPYNFKKNGTHYNLLKSLEASAQLSAEDGDDFGQGNEPKYSATGIDSRTKVWLQIRQRRGQATFRKKIRDRYGSHCLVTGCKILDILEAAHVMPYRGDSDHHPENGLLLRADIHTLFDLNLLGIEPESLEIRLHPSIATEYSDYQGRRLRCGDRPPSPEALRQRFQQFLATNDFA